MERDPERIVLASSDSCRAMLAWLEQNETKVRESVSRYPGEVYNSGLRYLLDRDGDLEWLIEQLRERVEGEDARIVAMPTWAQNVFAAITPAAG